jgi:hypothetical protein
MELIMQELNSHIVVSEDGAFIPRDLFGDKARILSELWKAGVWGQPQSIIKPWFKGKLWAVEVELSLDAEQKWEFIKALVSAAPDEDALASIGAGLLEDLLHGSSEEFIERVEQEAAANEKFRFSLSIVRNPALILKNPNRKEEIQQRIEKAVRNDMS